MREFGVGSREENAAAGSSSGVQYTRRKLAMVEELSGVKDIYIYICIPMTCKT